MVLLQGVVIFFNKGECARDRNSSQRVDNRCMRRFGRYDIAALVSAINILVLHLLTPIERLLKKRKNEEEVLKIVII